MFCVCVRVIKARLKISFVWLIISKDPIKITTRFIYWKDNDWHTRLSQTKRINFNENYRNRYDNICPVGWWLLKNSTQHNRCFLFIFFIFIFNRLNTCVSLYVGIDNCTQSVLANWVFHILNNWKRVAVFFLSELYYNGFTHAKQIFSMKMTHI